jgi:hypothetical protein
MKTILNNWSLMPGLRLAMGIVALVQAVTQKDVYSGESEPLFRAK